MLPTKFTKEISLKIITRCDYLILIWAFRTKSSIVTVLPKVFYDHLHKDDLIRKGCTFKYNCL